MKKLWFKRKLYGWGWYPVAWQGWLAVGLYTAIMFTLANTIDENAPLSELFFMLVLPMIIFTTALIRICYRFGESPRWQWGEKASYDLIAFDLDGTLAESKMPIDEEMATLLGELFAVKKVAIISGAGFPQFESQVLSLLPTASERINLYLLPTNGAVLLTYDGEWQTQYENTLTDTEKAKIFAAFEHAFTQTGYVHPRDRHGVVIEDRGTQITFSALGSTAPTALKHLWDPDHKKRMALCSALKKYIPEFSVAIGGMTSIDVTKGAIDKAYGVRRLLEHLHFVPEQVLFVGDALFKGGNDASVLSLGVAANAVKGLSETKRVIRNILQKKL